MTLWSDRFPSGTDRLLRRHGDSFSFDRILLPEEVRASVAYANALVGAGILTGRERDRIVRALRAIVREAKAGTVEVAGQPEDIHSFVEEELTRRIGAVAGKLHTGRSRNDQVATIYRLWLRDRVDGDLVAIDALSESLLGKAEEHPGALLPAYTHLQRAQPVLLAHHLLAHVEALLRDHERFGQARARIDLLPLGAAAGTGTAFPIDRTAVAHELGFSGVTHNSLDAVSDRDFLLDYLSAATILAAHLSRMAEEIVLYTTSEFAFARLSDAASTGSSIMPQKRNPDGAELVRGKTGRILGHLVAVAATLKGLPLSYNKDLQEGGAAILDAAESTRAALELARITVDAMEFDTKRMERALAGGFPEATELADWLARRGVPFRKAHGIAAHLVGEAESLGLTSLKELPDAVLAAAHPRLTPEARKALSPAAAVSARNVIGGTAPKRVRAEIRRHRRRLEKHRAARVRTTRTADQG